MTGQKEDPPKGRIEWAGYKVLNRVNGYLVGGDRGYLTLYGVLTRQNGPNFSHSERWIRVGGIWSKDETFISPADEEREMEWYASRNAVEYCDHTQKQPDAKYPDSCPERQF